MGLRPIKLFSKTLNSWFEVEPKFRGAPISREDEKKLQGYSPAEKAGSRAAIRRMRQMYGLKKANERRRD